MEIVINSVEEQNSFADDSMSSNGGGYSQPFYKFEYGNWKGSFSDTSCGDFGSRHNVTITDGTNEYTACWGTMDGIGYDSNFPTEFPAVGFYNAFESVFYCSIPTAEDVDLYYYDDIDDTWG